MDFVYKGVVLGLILAVAIGPVFFSLIQTSIKQGFGAGVFMALGISLSDVAYIVLVTFGMYQIFGESQWQHSMGMVGGGVLILFGLGSIIKARRKVAAVEVPLGERYSGVFRLIAKGFIINGVNPVVPLFWIGVGLSVSEYGFSGADHFGFFAVVIATVFITDLLKAYLAGKIRHWVTPRFLSILNVSVGVALILFGGRMLFFGVDI
jgi:threonine/homoserine/homoserine lactone efflux protein